MKSDRLRRMGWAALAALVVLLAHCAPALAASDGVTVRRALLIGNSSYNGGSDTLLSSAYDLTAMGQALKSGTMPYAKMVSKPNLTAAGIGAAVADAASWGADDDDVTVFYYSGHGAANGLSGTDDYATYSFAELQASLSNVPGTVIVLLDSCYSGALVGKSAASTGEAFVDNAIAAFAGSGAQLQAKGGLTAKSITTGTKFHVIASSSKVEQSWAYSNLYGLATMSLSEAMGWSHNGPRAGTRFDSLLGDFNGDKILTVGEAFDYAYDNVNELLKGRKDPVTGQPAKQTMQIYPAGSTQPLISRESVLVAKSNSMNITRACIAPGKTLNLSCGSAGAYWASSRTAVATVNPTTGVVTGVGTSSYAAVISARVGNTIVATCEVRVLPLRYVVQQVRLRRTELSLEIGSSYGMSVKFSPSGARYRKIYWKSGDPSVATVSSGGTIRAVKKGTTTITATATSGVTATCAVTVTGLTPRSVRLSDSKITLLPGVTTLEKAILAETVYPAAAEDKSVTWFSYNEKVATVNQDGQVTAVAPGKTVVRVTTNKNGKKAYCTVTVARNLSIPRTRPRSSSGKLVSSARRIYYSGNALIIDMYFYNRTRSACAVPSLNLGLIKLKLRNKSIVTALKKFETTRTLSSGRYLLYTMTLDLAAYPQLKNLDLRGSDATYDSND